MPVVATLHMSGVSPFMHEVEHRDNAVAIGGLWRAMQAEAIMLQENDRCLSNKRTLTRVSSRSKTFVALARMGGEN